MTTLRVAGDPSLIRTNTYNKYYVLYYNHNVIYLQLGKMQYPKGILELDWPTYTLYF